MKNNIVRVAVFLPLALVAAGLWRGSGMAGQEPARLVPPPVSPGPEDKCVVCGMFVAKYPGFLAEILFKDGTRAFFDGPKDMFRFYFDMGAYPPARKASDIAAIYVTDYYSQAFIDGHRALYVLGSDVYGPMGRELIPLEKEADAKTFAADHKGRPALKFAEITAQTVKEID